MWPGPGSSPKRGAIRRARSRHRTTSRPTPGSPPSPRVATRSTPRSPPTSCSGSSRRTCAASAATCSRWCGTDQLHGYRGVGPRARAATLEGVRERDDERRPTRCRRSVRTRCTVPGAVDGWFTLLERWGTRSFGEVAAPRPALRRGRVPAHASRRVVLRPEPWRLRPLRPPRLRQPRIADTDRGRLAPPARARAARSARSPTTVPTCTTRAPIGDAIADTTAAVRAAFMATDDLAAHDGCLGRPAASRRRVRAAREVARAAAADAGRHRARSAAHRRRSRPRRRRCRSRAPPHRGDEARARRPQRATSAIPTR